MKNNHFIWLLKTLSLIVPITKKSIQTRQMPIDTNAYQTFADQTFADHDFCLLGLLPIGYQNGFY